MRLKVSMRAANDELLALVTQGYQAHATIWAGGQLLTLDTGPSRVLRRADAGRWWSFVKCQELTPSPPIADAGSTRQEGRKHVNTFPGSGPST
jgi:hypothetical protein